MTDDSGWVGLRKWTGARVAIGRAGSGLPTSAHLAFQLAHARARDAVHAPLDIAALTDGLAAHGRESIAVHSDARDRREYLLRPDRGRRLNEMSRGLLSAHAGEFDLCVVLADGLSATAAQRHSLPLVDSLLPALERLGWTIAPIVVAEQSRVALADEVAFLLGARMVLILLGERPGLTTPHSLGAYLTWNPQPGVTSDAFRNCVSNIHHDGLGYETAAARLFYLLTEGRRRELTGVDLKDETPTLSLPAG